jgi:hypothetical protein
MRRRLEDELKKTVLLLEREGRKGKLFGHKGQEHMSAYYSWWVLDACGELLLESDCYDVRNLVGEILDNLGMLIMENSDSTFGYPLTLHGIPDAGATAQIGEIMLRFRSIKKDNKNDLILEFVLKMISERNLNIYKHHEFLWAVPCFLERFQSIYEQRTE